MFFHSLDYRVVSLVARIKKVIGKIIYKRLMYVKINTSSLEPLLIYLIKSRPRADNLQGLTKTELLQISYLNPAYTGGLGRGSGTFIFQ